MPGNSSGSSSRALLADLRKHLVSATAEVVWSQWSVVGGMASVRVRANALVDPESLVLMSLTLAPSEPRLYDVLSDWTAINADVLSVQRMRNLASRYPLSTQSRLTALARIAFQEAKDHRWKSLLADTEPIERRRNKPRAVRVSANEPAALTLRLRLAFGVGIKADLLAFLLCTHEAAATIAGIAAVTDYTPAAVRKATRDLTEATFVRSVLPTGDSTLHHRIVRAMWDGLIPRTPRWIDWRARFIFAASLLDWTTGAQERHVTEYAVESALRDLIEQHPAALESQWSDLSRSPTDAPVVTVEQFAKAMVAEV